MGFSKRCSRVPEFFDSLSQGSGYKCIDSSNPRGNRGPMFDGRVHWVSGALGLASGHVAFWHRARR